MSDGKPFERVFGKLNALDGASSLAVVAIASLGGPVAAAGAGLGQLVKLAEARLSGRADAASLRAAVAAAVRDWAEHESVADVGAGLDLAARVLASDGASSAEQATLAYDATAVADLVWQRARRRRPELRQMPPEDRLEVARRAIVITYDAINTRLASQDPMMAAHVESLRQGQLALGELAALRAEVHAVTGDHARSGPGTKSMQRSMQPLAVQGRSIVARLAALKPYENGTFDGLPPESLVSVDEYMQWEQSVRRELTSRFGNAVEARLQVIMSDWENAVDARTGSELDRALVRCRRRLAVLDELMDSAGAGAV